MPNLDGTPTPEEAYAAQISVTGNPAVDALLARPAPAPGPWTPTPAATPQPIPGDPVGAVLAANGVDPSLGVTPTPSEFAGPPEYQIGASTDPRVIGNGGTGTVGLIDPTTGELKTTSAGLAGTLGNKGTPPVITTPTSPFPTSPEQAPRVVSASGSFPVGMPAFSFANSEAVAAQGARALKAEGEAKAAGAKDQAEILRKQQEDALAFQNMQLQARSELNNEIARQTQDIRDHKIDPNRMWASKADGDRAASLIGILLSGIGSGLTKQPNLALEVINKAIERDINAQTAELGKKENLLSGLFRQYGNLEQAQNYARIFKTEAYARDLQAAALQHGGDAEAAHAEFLGSQLRAGVAQAKDQAANQMAQFRFQMSMMQGGGGAGQYENGEHATRPEGFDPAAYAKAANADKERTLPPIDPGGKAILAHSARDASDAKGRLVGIRGAYHLLDQIDRERGGAAAVPWSNDNAAIESKLDGLAFELARAYTGGIPGESAVKDAKSQLRGPFMAMIRGESSYQPVKDILESQRRSVYETYAPGLNAGITVPFTPVR